MKRTSTIRGSLETMGYSGQTDVDALQRVQDFLSRQPAVLIDIRFSPRSRWRRAWNKKALRTRYGESQYQHIKALGNVNYNKPDLPIQLLDPDEAVSHLVRLLHNGLSLLLVCTCADYDRCHRKVVYELVMDALKTESIKDDDE